MYVSERVGVGPVRTDRRHLLVGMSIDIKFHIDIGGGHIDIELFYPFYQIVHHPAPNCVQLLLRKNKYIIYFIHVYASVTFSKDGIRVCSNAVHTMQKHKRISLMQDLFTNIYIHTFLLAI